MFYLVPWFHSYKPPTHASRGWQGYHNHLKRQSYHFIFYVYYMHILILQSMIIFYLVLLHTHLAFNTTLTLWICYNFKGLTSTATLMIQPFYRICLNFGKHMNKTLRKCN